MYNLADDASKLLAELVTVETEDRARRSPGLHLDRARTPNKRPGVTTPLGTWDAQPSLATPLWSDLGPRSQDPEGRSMRIPRGSPEELRIALNMVIGLIKCDCI